jgi:hypothetical protein
LVFTPGDWAAKEVTVTAIDDSIVESDPENTQLEFDVSSGDTGYDNENVDPLEVSIYENDCGAWDYHQADLNSDCRVNLLDYAEFALQWLDDTFPNGADFNEDNQINLFDLAKLAAQWLNCSFPNMPNCDRPLPSQPNIILFIVDDMGWNDTSVEFHTQQTVWNELYQTPHMQTLANKVSKLGHNRSPAE